MNEMHICFLQVYFIERKRCFETEMYANSLYISIEWNLQTMTIFS